MKIDFSHNCEHNDYVASERESTGPNLNGSNVTILGQYVSCRQCPEMKLLRVTKFISLEKKLHELQFGI